VCGALSWGYARDYRPYFPPGWSGKADYFEWRILGTPAQRIAHLAFPNGIPITFAGTKFVLDPSSRHDLRLAMVLRSGRAYEQATLQAMKRILPIGGTFVDVGTNTGFFTAMLGCHVGAEGQIYAFEPNPQAYSRLKGNIEVNGLENVAAFNVGLSDHSSTEVLRIHEADDGTASLHMDEGREVSVALARGDDMIDRKPDLIKIDVEGHEIPAIQGLSRSLESAALIVEWNPEYASDALFGELTSRYPHLCAITEDRSGTLSLQSILRRQDLRFACNLLCTHRPPPRTPGIP